MRPYQILTLAASAFMALQVQAAAVFVQSNRADQNSLLAFDLAANGALQPSSIAEVPTSGQGIVDSTFALGPFDSDQEIIVNPAHTLLFSANSGSDSIAVFNIHADLSLHQVTGSPFASQGATPVSLGLKGNVLTVVNKGRGTTLPNYATFLVSAKGQLQPVAGSMREVASGSSPSQALISPLAPLVFGADFLGGLLQSFALTSGGALVRRTTQGLPASEFANDKMPRFPLGLVAHPAHPYLYVGFPTANKIGVYQYNQWGNLRFHSTVADSGTAVCWLVMNRKGTRLYASNTGDASVTVYDTESDPAKPREIQKLMLPTRGGAYQLALSPNQEHLLVVVQRFQGSIPQGEGNEIHSLRVDTHSGKIDQTGLVPVKLQLPGDTRPQGIVIL
jgi:6-phosphogluconolactonase (cycloisomerase 2 family)